MWLVGNGPFAEVEEGLREAKRGGDRWSPDGLLARNWRSPNGFASNMGAQNGKTQWGDFDVGFQWFVIFVPMGIQG